MLTILQAPVNFGALRGTRVARRVARRKALTGTAKMINALLGAIRATQGEGRDAQSFDSRCRTTFNRCNFSAPFSASFRTSNGGFKVWVSGSNFFTIT